MSNLILCYLLQILFTLGIIIIFGFLIGLCNKIFYRLLGTKGSIICKVTGILGTPVHELSHALGCILFGHKIVSMKLFNWKSEDGTLGYVEHTYKPKNFYQKVGNLFIGIAPIIVISALLALLSYLILPEMLYSMLSNGEIDTTSNLLIIPFKAVFNLVIMFSYADNWQWWIFIIISCVFSLHMTLSKADIKNSLSGIIIYFVGFLLADLIIYFISGDLLATFTSGLVMWMSLPLCFMEIALCISIICIIVALLFKLFSKKVLKIIIALIKKKGIS